MLYHNGFVAGRGMTPRLIVTAFALLMLVQPGKADQAVKADDYSDMIAYNRWYLKQAGFPVEDDGTCGAKMAQSTFAWIAAASEETFVWMAMDGLSAKDGCSFDAQFILHRTIKFVHADRG